MGGETAAVHFQLAEAYVRLLRTPPATTGGHAARHAAAMRHAERAAALFASGSHWRDSAAAHCLLAELRAGCFSGDVTNAKTPEMLAAEAFAGLRTAESIFLATDDASSSEIGIKEAISQMRAAMVEILRAILHRSINRGVA